MLREMPVRSVMTTDVVSFTPDQNIQDAMQQLAEREIDAGPVVDTDGSVVGMLSTGDLIVGEARVHFPTVTNFFGVNVAWPFHDKEFNETLDKALGATVGEVMTAKPRVIGPDDSIEDAATLMHDHNVSRLPVVDGGGSLVGVIARGDIVKAIVAGVGDAEPADNTDS